MAIDLIGLQALQDEKTLGKLEIDTHTEASITQLATATEGYKEDLENEKDELVVTANDVISEGNAQVTRVETIGTTEVENVEAKGTEVKAEIDLIIQGDPEGGNAIALGGKTRTEFDAEIAGNTEQIQILSADGTNVYIADDTGKQSLMVKIPRFKISDVLDGVLAGDDGWHPAFVVNGVVKDCIYISKYQNIVENNRAYSLGGKTPRAYINFDQAKSACEAKGAGWHLMSNAEWAAIALWCKKNETEPLGNNYAGSHYIKKHLCGSEGYTWKTTSDWNERAYKEDPLGTYWHTGTAETGSTPKEFAHNGETDGIYDLNGNVWEWVGGVRLNNGEIQVTVESDADMSLNSTEWKAMLQDGSYVVPGTAGTLKYDNTSGVPKLNVTTDSSYKNTAFKDLLEETGIIVPAILKTLTLAPSGNLEEDGAYINTEGERLPLRGGNWLSASSTGVFTLYLDSVRTYSSSSVGFRSAFVI